jgi:hypothetical protein
LGLFEYDEADYEVSEMIGNVKPLSTLSVIIINLSIVLILTAVGIYGFKTYKKLKRVYYLTPIWHSNGNFNFP